MKLLMISAIAAISLLAAATTMLRSHPRSADHVGMPSLQELQGTSDANKLPAEEFEDQSLVFSNKTKH